EKPVRQKTDAPAEKHPQAPVWPAGQQIDDEGQHHRRNENDGMDAKAKSLLRLGHLFHETLPAQTSRHGLLLCGCARRLWRKPRTVPRLLEWNALTRLDLDADRIRAHHGNGCVVANTVGGGRIPRMWYAPGRCARHHRATQLRGPSLRRYRRRTAEPTS